mmetsp:Transcript_22476/g.28362  ORF Transcript_22476/g.28362 Transcript_22476/m.28362 type:complete len:169 (-) Transcript_22476:218-724(-)
MKTFLSKAFALCVLVAATMLDTSKSQGTGFYEMKNSHLSCFPARNNKRFSALIDLHANEYQERYTLKRCKVLYRFVELCIPSTKEVLKFDGETVNADIFPKGRAVYNDLLCYKMRCDAQNRVPEKQLVAGQFGKHDLEIFQNYLRLKVCIPAWKLKDSGEPTILEYDY